MKPELLIETLKSMVLLDRAVMLEGPPGVGKTEIARSVASDMGLPLIYVHTPSKLIEDFGIPYPHSEGCGFGFRILDWLPVVGSEHPANGVMLFDEASQASGDLQKIIGNLIQSRECHGFEILPGWRFILTGNRVGDRAGANRLLSHLRDRTTTLSVDFDAEQWGFWAERNAIDQKVIAYSRFAPQNILNFDPTRDLNSTPRGWAEGVSPLLGKVPASALLECVQGAIGSAASEFIAFCDHYLILPTKKEFMAQPADWVLKLKKDHAELEPSLGWALASMLLSEMSVSDFEAAMEAATHLPYDLGSLVFQSYVKRVPAVATQKTQIMRAGVHRYNGVLFGEGYAEKSAHLG